MIIFLIYFVFVVGVTFPLIAFDEIIHIRAGLPVVVFFFPCINLIY